MYVVYGNTISLFPCDEQEQDLLDIFHELFARVQYAYSPSHSSRPTGNARVLDLGCGTGIWAIDLAKQYPNAYVLGFDIAATQPPNYSPNCEFSTPFDFERAWVGKGESWDCIHLQLRCGGVRDWPSVYRKACAHLRPGGWFEQLEIDFERRCDNGSLEETAFAYWYKYLKEATEKLERPLAHSSHETVAELHKAGFTQIWHRHILLPLNPWPLDVNGRHIGRWYSLAMDQSIETLGLAPFSRAFGWPLGKIQRLSADVKLDILACPQL